MLYEYLENKLYVGTGNTLIWVIPVQKIYIIPDITVMTAYIGGSFQDMEVWTIHNIQDTRLCSIHNIVTAPGNVKAIARKCI